MIRDAAPVLLGAWLLPGTAVGHDFRGQLELFGAGYPSQHVAEARGRIFGRYETALGKTWVVVASGAIEAVAGSGAREADAIFRLQDTYVERRGDRLELRLGASNVVWGVLDEIQPTDVVNSLDLARFVLEGRAEGRLPTLLARARWFLPKDLSLEAVLAPFPRRGRFDSLGEDGSPFTPKGFALLPRSDLPRTARNMELGFRLRGTRSRVDWGASFYRDVSDFDRYEASPAGLTALRPVRFMVGGDMEMARGDWVLRGEGAFYVDDPIQKAGPPRIERRTTFQGGFGVDRRLGDKTLFLNALYARTPGTPEPDEISLVGGLSRDSARGTRTIKVFGIWNALSSSGFLRAVWSAEIVENLRLEVEGGLFYGEGGQPFTLLSDSDFVLARLRFYF